MTQPQSVPAVSADGLLARFVTDAGWVRADKTIRQDAFIPPRDLNLSVTRHLNLSQQELWKLGQKVVDAISGRRSAALHGRADLPESQVSKLRLSTKPFPVAGNPNHAHITGWPPDKPAQKSIAQQLAAAAKFVAKP